MNEISTGTLFIVATPIGNLEDITLRALRVLGEVDTIFCEDTRITNRLLQKYEINTKTQSINARTEDQKTGIVLSMLEGGQDVAYVSDAGTPGISDPGVRLVVAARAVGARVEAIPGASAITTALSIAGVPTNKFTFLGFLPQKKGRKTAINNAIETDGTVVLYESTHRIVKFLKELCDVLPATKGVKLARELTKLHEEVLAGSPDELLAILQSNPQKTKGEFVVILHDTR